jgi:hypothetical protein
LKIGEALFIKRISPFSYQKEKGKQGDAVTLLDQLFSAFVPPSTAQRDPSSSSATGLLQALQRCAPLKSGLPHEEQ